MKKQNAQFVKKLTFTKESIEVLSGAPKAAKAEEATGLSGGTASLDHRCHACC